MLSLAVMTALTLIREMKAQLMSGERQSLDAYALLGWWWADPVGALAMLPVILWQGWETLAEAREPADHED